MLIPPLLLIGLFLVSSQQAIDCDIVIAGGTLAALGAAVESSSLRTCLVEPTDRLGGQWGEEGVWHIDFNWLYQPGFPDNSTAYNPVNLHPLFRKVTTQCNTGDCWVSRNCFLYSCLEPILQQYIAPKVEKGSLVIFWNSTVKETTVVLNSIKQVTIIRRTQALKVDCREADLRVKDWYDKADSEYYSKQVVTLKVNYFAIEATQYGDLLVLTKAPFNQGTPNNDACGQSIVFCLHQEYPDQMNSLSKEKSENDVNDDNFSLGTYTVDQVWRYRRLLGKGLAPKPGEICLQNWDGPGNDYRGGYIFQPVNQIDRDDWKGGLNFTTLREAEARSLRYHQWFKIKAALPLKATGKYFNTCNGLAKLPYMRDGRRSIAYKNFSLKGDDVTGVFVKEQKVTGTAFEDRLSLGFYNMDLHSIDGCSYDPFGQSIPLPFFLPARAFTNNKIKNLVVVGRAMAQEFNASMATRTHSTEFSSGVGGMLMATYMSGLKMNSSWDLLECGQCIVELQNIIRRVMPLQWTIAGKLYPGQENKVTVTTD